MMLSASRCWISKDFFDQPIGADCTSHRARPDFNCAHFSSLWIYHKAAQLATEVAMSREEVNTSLGICNVTIVKARAGRCRPDKTRWI